MDYCGLPRTFVGKTSANPSACGHSSRGVGMGAAGLPCASTVGWVPMVMRKHSRPSAGAATPLSALSRTPAILSCVYGTARLASSRRMRTKRAAAQAAGGCDADRGAGHNGPGERGGVECARCTLLNAAGAALCAACETPRREQVRAGRVAQPRMYSAHYCELETRSPHVASADILRFYCQAASDACR